MESCRKEYPITIKDLDRIINEEHTLKAKLHYVLEQIDNCTSICLYTEDCTTLAEYIKVCSELFEEKEK